MLRQLEGSQGVAHAIALSRPNVVCAYPITPQTHIVEHLGEMVRSKALHNCEFINVESEFAALSVAIGSEAAGVRSYTATSSQGLLFMTEAVYNASGLELPVVMTIGNRAIGAPLNIWNDHSDAMSVRDAGWIMLFAEDNQEALDLHIQAFKVAEKLQCPTMVCVDGFILTHAYDRLDIPSQSEVDQFLPPYNPEVCMSTSKKYAIGTMVPPDYFTEVKYLAHQKQKDAIAVIDCVASRFHSLFGRESGGLVRQYLTQDAETIIVAMGSVLGTIKDTVDDLNATGSKIGVLSVVSYRPFPKDKISSILKKAKRVIVVEKAFAVGIGGILYQEICMALRGSNVEIISVIAGLGGRDITKTHLKEVFSKKEHSQETIFLTLNQQIIDREYSKTEACNCSSN